MGEELKRQVRILITDIEVLENIRNNFDFLSKEYGVLSSCIGIKNDEMNSILNTLLGK